MLKNGSKIFVSGVAGAPNILYYHDGISTDTKGNKIPYDQIKAIIHSHTNEKGAFVCGASGSDYRTAELASKHGVRLLIAIDDDFFEYKVPQGSDPKEDLLIFFTDKVKELHHKKFDLYNNNLTHAQTAEITRLFTLNNPQYVWKVTKNKVDEIINM